MGKGTVLGWLPRTGERSLPMKCSGDSGLKGSCGTRRMAFTPVSQETLAT